MWININETDLKKQHQFFRCPDGFLGNRCETKNPTNLQPSTYNKKEQQQCGDNKFYGSYYC